MSTITVQSCAKVKEVNGKPVYKVGLSDGRYGESFAVAIPTGTPVGDVDIQETPFGLKFKLQKKNGFPTASRAAKGNESFALSYAKDVVIAMLPRMEKVPKSEELATVITTLGDRFYTWLESKRK